MPRSPKCSLIFGFTNYIHVSIFKFPVRAVRPPILLSANDHNAEPIWVLLDETTAWYILLNVVIIHNKTGLKHK
jgi:hypothetical protein